MPDPADPPARHNKASRQPGKWLVWTGACLLTLAGCCAIATAAALLETFDTAAAGFSAPAAHQVQNALLPAYGIIPLGLVGGGLLGAGYAIRRTAQGKGGKAGDE